MNERGTKRRPLKGAVLFTVLCVLAVILIMMLVTIGLSSVASRRAYSEYYDAQINATGRSVISSVLKSLDPEHGTNKNLGKTIYTEVGTNGKYEVHLSNNGNLGQGLGRVDKIVFEKAGVDSAGKFYVTGSDVMIMKITATITMGNKTTTYTEYASNMVHIPGKGGGNGGLLSTSGASSAGTGMIVLGPFGGGFKDYTRDSTGITLGEEGAFAGHSFFNKSINVNTYKTFVFNPNKPAESYDIADISKADYQGVSVLGDLVLTNNNVPFVSLSASSSTQTTPYIFCTGTFDASGVTRVGIGSIAEASDANNNVEGTEGGTFSDFIKKVSGNKVNLYCGSFKFPDQNSFNIASDIYCYNETQESVLGGGINESPLTNWIEQQVNGGTVVNGNCVIGNIYTKGNLKLTGTNIGIKGNVYVNGELNLKEVVNKLSSGKSPSIEGKIYCSSVEPADYATAHLTVAGVSPSYPDLVSKIEIVNGNKFPADKELDQILGITFTGSPSTGSAQLSAIDNAQYSLDTGADFTKKIIQSPREMHEKYYMDDASDTNTTKRKILRNSYNQSGVAPGADTWTESNVPAEITEQCVLSGSFSGKTITITPKPKSDDQPLWILLDGASFYGTDIIVKNVIKDSENNDVELGPVCFYIKDNTDLYFGNGSRMLTETYEEYYTGVSLTKNISITNGSVPSTMIPNIYIYGSNREDQGNNETITIQNGAIITAYIVAPRAVLKASNMASAGTGKVCYDGIEYDAKGGAVPVKVGIIGSAIVGPIETAQNEIALLYVDNSTGGTGTPPSDWFKYQTIQGFTNY